MDAVSPRAVFLSYASQDAEAARRIADALRVSGIQVWFDEHALRGGDVWDAAIRQRIKHCTLFIPLISQSTERRTEGYFRLEWKLAVERTHCMAEDRPFLLPIALDEVAAATAVVPETFRRVQWTRLTRGNLPPQFLNRVKSLMGGNPAVSAPAAAIDLPGAESMVHAVAPAKSILVLPLANLSPDPDQEYFSDGLTDEIITELSRTGEFLVISRNSALTFKGTKKRTREIAQEVNVRYVLAGSVRKAGDSLRITAQFIDAFTDTLLWAEKYAGTLRDVFAIQEKVSCAIAHALEAQFRAPGHGAASRILREDPQVYEIYLRARHANWQFTAKSLATAEALLTDGIRTRGGHELFYTELCHLHVQYVNNLIKPPAEYPRLLATAIEYAQEALQANPDSALANYANGLALYQSGRPEEALRSFHRALALEPNQGESMLYLMLGFLYSATGLNPILAEQYLERARRIDPLTPVARTSQGWRLLFLGRFQDAVAEFASWERSMEHSESVTLLWFAWFHALNQDFAKSFAAIERLESSQPHHVASSLGRFFSCACQQQKSAALAEVTDAVKQAAWWDDAYALMMAEGYALIGEYVDAFRYLNRAIDYGIVNSAFLAEHDPLLDRLRGEPQFSESISRASHLLESLHRSAAT